MSTIVPIPTIWVHNLNTGDALEPWTFKLKHEYESILTEYDCTFKFHCLRPIEDSNRRYYLYMSFRNPIEAVEFKLKYL